MTTQITYNTPAMPPPPGTESNFVNPPDWYSWTLGVGIPSMVIMTLCVCIRTYTKIAIMKQLRHEDYIAILAVMMFLVWCGIYIYLASIGVTRDLWNIRAVDMPHLLYLFNVIQVIYGPAMLCAKYFILVQLKRIFCPRGMKGAVWWAINILIAITIAYYISCFFTFLFQCVPREAIWNGMVHGSCINRNAGVMSAGFINLIIDLCILCLPVWAIWHLQMPLKRKLGVAAIFTAGFATCGLAAAGVAYRFPLLTDANETRASAKVGLWTFAELTGTILIGCMPMMPHFYDTKLAPGLSRFSRTSLKSLISSRRTAESHTQSTESRGSAFDGSHLKPMNQVTMSDRSSSTEYNHDDVELQNKSADGANHGQIVENV